MRARHLVPLLVAAALAVPLAPSGGSPAAAQVPLKPLAVEVLSNRADLVSGGDALVSVTLPAKVSPAKVQVLVGGRDVTGQFAVRPDGQFEGLVTGLALGENVVTVKAPGYAGRQVITNHPNGGPVFSGPQHGPYQCQSTALDAQCNEPASYSLLYKSSDPTQPGLLPYDPENPPSDVAETTTDEGVTVPFIVRREDGYQARDRYSILTLFRPGQDWAPWKPQDQWNHKVLATHGGGCGASYSPGSPRLDDYSGTIPAFPGIENSYVTALGRGFAVMSAALNNTGHNCSLPRQAESMVMLKERLVEQYGPVRYTIGTGCSGGSIAQHTIANAYPGVYQGLVTTCSYPDVLTAGAQFADYHLLAALLRAPGPVGRRRGLVADADGAGRGPRVARQRGHRGRGAVQGRDQPGERLLGHQGPGARRHQHPLRLRDQPGRRALLDPRHDAQRARPAGPKATGPRRSRRPATASPASRSPTSGCSTASAP